MSTQIKSLWALALALALAAPVPAAPLPVVEDLLDLGHYSEALQALERASDQGDAEAALQAGLMHLYGSALFGKQVSRDLTRALHYLVRAARADLPVARYIVRRLGAPQATDSQLADGISESGC
jgi:TPR repeat protein